MKVNPVIKIGIGVTLALVATVWGLAFLKGKNVFKSGNSFHALYASVDGLTTASPVTMNGLKVGTVQSIDFSASSIHKLVVGFNINEKYAVPKGSIAEIYSMDLMGSKAIRIKRVQNSQLHESGDTLKAKVESDLAEAVNRQIIPLKNKAESLMGSLDSVLIAVKQVFTNEAQNDIQSSLTSISGAIRAFERAALRADTLVLDQKEHIAEIMEHAASITQNIENNNENITRILSNTAQLSDSLATADIGLMVRDLQNSINNINALLNKVEKGEGSLGALMNNDSLYHNLENATRNLDYLLIDFRKNPKKYVHFSVFDRGNTYVVDEKEMEKIKNKANKEEKNK